jgi:PAS domain S-box-containing protein
VLSVQVAWRFRRRSWLMAAAGGLAALYSGLSGVATYTWDHLRSFTGVPGFDFGDVLFFADYGLLLALAVTVFTLQGGSFRRARTWLDAVTIFASLSIAFWAVLSGVLRSPVKPTGGSIFTLPYAVGLAVIMTMGALLWMQNARRGYAAAILVALATLAAASAEFAWLANWLESADFLGNFYPVVQVIVAVMLANAITRMEDMPNEPDPTAVALSAQNFLPVFAASVSIALIAGFLGTTREPAAWLMVVFMVLALALLVTREGRVRQELTVLRQGLARRAADERLTELVRRSGDLIVVADAAGVIVYASPAAEQLVGVGAEHLIGRELAQLFGPAHRPAMTTLVDTLGAGAGRVWEIEVIRSGDGAAERVLKLTGVNQLANPLIAGIVLTIKDITAQRAVERQMLEVATLERLRLSGELHDGLGQELTGIAMLLQGVATTPNPAPETFRSELLQIVSHLNHAIMGTRHLAHGLAPVKVVSGSLGHALQLLGKEIAHRYHIVVDVDVDPAVDDFPMVDAAADHLYRIAQEALLNAARHGECGRASVALLTEGQLLRLRIRDDGRGFAEERPADAGIGLQLMEFRARIMGGRLSVAGRGEPGARIELQVPLSRIGSGAAGAGAA